MNLFDKITHTEGAFVHLMLFTLCVGIVIGTLVNQGVKAAKRTIRRRRVRPRW